VFSETSPFSKTGKKRSIFYFYQQAELGEKHFYFCSHTRTFFSIVFCGYL